MSNLYSDIAARTGGNIYIGVVGPVRTGKSTFIKRFMETLVLPNITGEGIKKRAVDELPQSATGKMIMTTEPKFIPEEAVEVEVESGVRFKTRLIDCVGYVVEASDGYMGKNGPRLVQCPWSKEPMPFERAAEIGTRKVIREHSTVGIVITTDGSVGELTREDYTEAENRVVRELKQLNKPFVMVLNSAHPQDEETKKLRRYLEERYGVPVIALSCFDMGIEEISSILKLLLYRFPVREVAVTMPGWVNSLPADHSLKTEIFQKIRACFEPLDRISNLPDCVRSLTDCPYIVSSDTQSIDLSSGSAKIAIALQEDLLYKMIAESTGLPLEDESDLLPLIGELAACKKKYDKISDALNEVEATGYGIVMPDIDELKLEEPEIVKQGSRYGVKLRASAPSIHLMRANINTEVSPIVGSEQQSEELVLYLLKEFEENPLRIWQSNIFGKSLHELVNEGLRNKLCRMPADARAKIGETLERVINEGCSGLICIII